MFSGYKICIKVFLIACFFVTSFASLHAVIKEQEAKYFVIKDVRGQVLFWQPWSAKWRPVQKGQRILENSLIQVEEGSDFVFEALPPKGKHLKGLKAEKYVVQVREPMVFRLTDGIFRKISFNPIFIEQLPELQTKADQKEAPLSFKEAWERLVAVVNGKVPLDQAMTQDKGVALGVKSKEIKLFMPPKDSVFLVKSFPMKLDMQWQAVPEDGVEYEVTLWKKGTEKKNPVAVTKRTQQTVKIKEEGSYMYQISSSDGAWQSPVSQVHTSYPVGNFMAEKDAKVKMKDRKAQNPMLPLLSPPNNFSVIVKKMPEKIDFVWGRTESVPDFVPFDFVVLDHLGKEIVRKSETRTATSVQFKEPGDFYWFVEARIPPNKVRSEEYETMMEELKIVSQGRRISIIESSVKNDPSEILEKMILGGLSDGIIYVEF